ncbi:MAG: TonB-dependent receptor, partial [Odoribacter sp.]|nr:TonB-dependent receptor [Odoribacter sp.]
MLLALMTFVVVPLWAQLTFSGKVTEASNGRSLQGASVRLEGTTIGTATDRDGRFVLKNVPEGEYVLRVTFTGFESVREQVKSSREDLLFPLKALPVHLNQVVITGTGTHHRLKDSPVPIEVISGSELRKAGLVKLDDALRMQNPSFNFSTTAMGDYTTMNGLQNDYVLILVNGKKLAGDISGNTDLRRIDMNRVKRIEILKGAASALYGSEAMGGVVNIITEEPKENLLLLSHTRIAEEGQFTQNLSADVNAGKFSSHTSYQRLQAGGWQVSPYETDDDDPRGYVETVKQASNRFRSDVFNQKFGFAPVKNLEIYAEGNYYQRHVYRPVKAYAYDMDYQDYTLGIGAKYLLNNRSYISLDLYNDNYENEYDYIKDSGKKKEGDKVLNLRQHYYNGNLKGVFVLGRLNKLSAGLEFREDRLKSPDAGIEETKGADTWALYAQDELKLFGRLQIVAGLRYTHHEAFGDRLSPKASVMLSAGDFNFRVNYASGFRAPDMKQLYYKKIKGSTLSIGNPDLDPETSNYYSANIEYAGQCFNVSVSGYINKVDDLISTKKVDLEPGDKEDGIKSRKLYVNLNDATLKGVEVNLSTYFG